MAPALPPPVLPWNSFCCLLPRLFLLRPNCQTKDCSEVFCCRERPVTGGRAWPGVAQSPREQWALTLQREYVSPHAAVAAGGHLVHRPQREYEEAMEGGQRKGRWQSTRESLAECPPPAFWSSCIGALAGVDGGQLCPAHITAPLPRSSLLSLTASDSSPAWGCGTACSGGHISSPLNPVSAAIARVALGIPGPLPMEPQSPHLQNGTVVAPPSAKAC